MKANVREDKIIVKMYTDNKSTPQIAQYMSEKYPSEKWYPVKVIRMLKRNGIAARSRSEAQRKAIELGLSHHPTRGKKRSDEEKEAISKGFDKYLASLSKMDLKKRMDKISIAARRKWNKLSAKEQQKCLMGMRANRSYGSSLSDSGSKFERKIAAALEDEGLNIRHRYKLDSHGKEIDILIGDNNALEIDGPMHWLPVYGDEQLEKTMARDDEKNKLLMGAGFYTLRYRIRRCSTSMRALRRIIGDIKQWLNDEGRDKLTIIEEGE